MAIRQDMLETEKKHNIEQVNILYEHNDISF